MQAEFSSVEGTFHYCVPAEFSSIEGTINNQQLTLLPIINIKHTHRHQYLVEREAKALGV